MLDILHSNGLPHGFRAVDPTVEFQAGMLAGLTLLDGEVVWTVANGMDIVPLGIIDDNKVTAFSTTVKEEKIIITKKFGEFDTIKPIVESDGKLLEPAIGKLAHGNIVASSFRSLPQVELNVVNGLITLPEGTELNYDLDEDGVNDSIQVIASYAYEIADVPGENTTLGSGKLTVWLLPGEYATDQYEPDVDYSVNDLLFCSPNGKLTTEQSIYQQGSHRRFSPAVGIVTVPPSTLQSLMQFVFFGPSTFSQILFEPQ